MAISPKVLASDEGLAADPFGQDRLLVVCLPDDREATTEEMAFIYALDWDAFSERDLRIIGINQQSIYDYRADKVSDTHLATQIISRFPINAERIKKRVNCEQEFEKILIGKDTGVKARWSNDFTQEDLFARIDAMPMRRFEMREKRKDK